MDREEIFERKVRNGKVKALVEALSAEAGFLVPPEVQKAMAKMGDDNDRRVMKVHAILQALGVEAEADITRLLDYFFNDADAAEAAKAEADALIESGAAPEPVGNQDAAAALARQFTVKPEDLAAVLAAFVEDRGSADAAAAAAAAGGGGALDEEAASPRPAAAAAAKQSAAPKTSRVPWLQVTSLPLAAPASAARFPPSAW
jgi:hypothetical protein